jgi:hypothetical protein
MPRNTGITRRHHPNASFLAGSSHYSNGPHTWLESLRIRHHPNDWLTESKQS